MKRAFVGVLGLMLVVLLAPPALAARARANAADDAVAWGSTDLCIVYVDHRYTHEVNLFCADSGRAWVKVRVAGVTGKVTRVIANGDGDCSGGSVAYTKRGNVVKVKILHTGDFDCTYGTVVVRFAD